MTENSLSAASTRANSRQNSGNRDPFREELDSEDDDPAGHIDDEGKYNGLVSIPKKDKKNAQNGYNPELEKDLAFIVDGSTPNKARYKNRMNQHDLLVQARNPYLVRI